MASSSNQPNIIVIMADQLAPHFCGAYDHPLVKTPRMDALAARGMRFDAAYCNAPLCAPSRFSWLFDRVCERVIGSIRRDCLNHVVILNERHLRRMLCDYVSYHHTSRTHLSLNKDPPETRSVDSPEMGNIVAFPHVGGLHHRYSRIATWWGY